LQADHHRRLECDEDREEFGDHLHIDRSPSDAVEIREAKATREVDKGAARLAARDRVSIAQSGS
jgi:hypothetical protein